MKSFKYLVFGMIGYLFIGCGSEAKSGHSISYSSPISTSMKSVYVNERVGVDGDIKLGYGSSSHPFKTISYAIKNSSLEDVFYNRTKVYIAGGKYNKENGEIFPINLPKGISLLTYNDDSNLSVEIDNSTSIEKNTNIAIILNGNNRLSNLKISSLSTAVLSKEGNNSLLFTTITNSKNAITLQNNSYLTIVNSIIENNSHSGIELSNTSTLKLLNSEINSSNIGIFVSDSATIDGDSKSSKIRQNRECDFFTDGYSDIKLQGIEWDDNIFDFNLKRTCTDGNNIVNIGEGTISYQTMPIEDNTFTSEEQLFINAKNKIILLSPKFEETIFTPEPTIKYSNSLNSKYIMVTIWNKIPKVTDNKIINPKDIFWYWHTGMKMDNSSMGIINYKDGKNPINGDINNENKEKPVSLKAGRAYYIAIWEWDSKNAIEVVSSSSISIFYISP